MPDDKLIIEGARQHNLKNINLEIPRNTLTVITGCQVPVRVLWLLTPYMLRGRGGTSSPCLHTPGSSWGS